MTQVEPGASGTVTLAPHPTSAKAARRHVAQVLESGPLSELTDTATLLVSEVVTNAVLHAATDIVLSCTVEHGSVCIEVRDRSLITPSPRHYDNEATTGRGLGMVELLADEWGVDPQEDGKTVWFQLAGPEAEPVVPRPTAADTAPDPPSVDVQLLNLPVDLVLTTIQYGDAVLREVALLSIASHPSAGNRPAPTPGIDLGPLLDRVEEAKQAGHSSVDIVLGFPEHAGRGALERLALVDEADRMARDGQLLMPAAVPEIGLCRRWLFGQVSLQTGGSPSTAWSMPEPMEPVVGPVRLPDDEVRALDAAPHATVVADDANRILYVNAACADLLGWEANELVGRRLVTIIPPEHRAAHLAGFTRYLLTGEARLLGERVRLPALRCDGSVVDVEITIEMADHGGRQVFRATFW